ncbi:PLD nuclease N-terminal domain-containing protein [Kribbella sp. DT2]|uniref:PLD nuclease N-terminal domain-containing protein n=1 Tax=Kribbella sp. DT2 TaxID=3393427 RepID=UPI003CF27CBC
MRYLPFLISLALTVYALFSCIQTRTEDVPYLPKLVWLVLIVFVPFAGPIVWLLMSRNARRPERPVRRTPAPGRPVAPDDDPDFLATLERYRDPRMGGKLPPLPADPPQDGKDKGKDGKDKGKGKGKGKDKPDSAKDSEAPTESDDGKS